MPCKREARKRHNTIAFWLSDEEKAVVEARIILSGLQKGQYYRAAILGEEVKVIAGNYLSNRVAIAIEKLSLAVMDQDTEESSLLIVTRAFFGFPLARWKRAPGPPPRSGCLELLYLF